MGVLEVRLSGLSLLETQTPACSRQYIYIISWIFKVATYCSHSRHIHPFCTLKHGLWVRDNTLVINIRQPFQCHDHSLNLRSHTESCYSVSFILLTSDIIIHYPWETSSWSLAPCHRNVNIQHCMIFSFRVHHLSNLLIYHSITLLHVFASKCDLQW